MKTNAIVTCVCNNHITDEYGVTISDEFFAKYKSGAKRKFECRNRISKNVAAFIKAHAENSTAESITDKKGTTHTSIMWKH